MQTKGKTVPAHSPEQARVARRRHVRPGPGEAPRAEAVPGDTRGAFRPVVLLALLFVATFLAYRPAWHGAPLWDDAAHLTRPGLREVDGLRRIWLEPGATQQYYPLVHTAFWIQHRLWGDETLGYHLVNVALHLVTALLVYALLRRLRVPGALLAAAVFALHPVHVESVAWMTELKNTLSGALFAAAALAYIRFDESRRSRAYGLALALFVLGLLAKTVVAVFPAAILVILWWRRGRLDPRRDVLPLVPFCLLGLAAGIGTAWFERHYVMNGLALPLGLGPTERVLVAGRAIWFYLGKLAWPAGLTFVYPRWDLGRPAWWAFLFPAGAVLLVLAAFALRRRWRGPLAALLFFVAALLPALGFVDVYPFRFSFVADHFQYLASLGPIVFACALAAAWSGRQAGPIRRAALVASLLLPCALAVLTFRQSRLYASDETLWRATLERNPRCFLALNNLGVIRLERHEDAEAERLFFEALRANPEYEAALNNCGLVLARRGRVAEAAGYFRRAVAIWPDFPDAHVNLGNAFFVLGRPGEAIGHFEKALALRPNLLEPRNNLALALVAVGRPAEAIPHFERALSADGGARSVLLGLARTLCTNGDARVRNGWRAVELAERAVQITGGRDVASLDVLAAANAEVGRFPEAVSVASSALALARARGLAPAAAELEQRLALYTAGRPFHEP